MASNKKLYQTFQTAMARQDMETAVGSFMRLASTEDPPTYSAVVDVKAFAGLVTLEQWRHYFTTSTGQMTLLHAFHKPNTQLLDLLAEYLPPEIFKKAIEQITPIILKQQGAYPYSSKLLNKLDRYISHSSADIASALTDSFMLHMAQAIQLNNISAMAFLLKHAVDLSNCSAHQHKTMLQQLHGHTSAEMLNLLISNGVDITLAQQVDTLNQTLAYKAAKANNQAVVKILKSHGCQLDGALHAAIVYHHDALIDKLLTEPQLNINATDRDGNTVAHLLVNTYFSEQQFAALITHSNIDFMLANRDGALAAHALLKHNHPAQLLMLIEKGIIDATNVNKPDKNGNTLAHLAAENGYLEVLTKLQDLNADMTFANREGNTPAHLAAQQGHLPILQNIQLAGVDINIPNNNGNSPTHLAIMQLTKSGRYSESEKLISAIKRGADINKAGGFPLPLIHVAAARGDIDCLRFFHTQQATLNTAVSLPADEWRQIFSKSSSVLNSHLDAYIKTHQDDVGNVTITPRALAEISQQFEAVQFIDTFCSTKSPLAASFDEFLAQIALSAEDDVISEVIDKLIAAFSGDLNQALTNKEQIKAFIARSSEHFQTIYPLVNQTAYKDIADKFISNVLIPLEPTAKKKSISHHFKEAPTGQSSFIKTFKANIDYHSTRETTMPQLRS